MTEQLSGGDMLIRSLQDEGVEYIFGYPAQHYTSMTLYFGSKSSISWFVMSRQQLIWLMGMHALPVIWCSSVTSGPGATNAITGIATAYMDSIPMVVISGQVPRDLIGTDAFQETDMVGISPVVKHGFLVRDGKKFPV